VRGGESRRCPTQLSLKGAGAVQDDYQAQIDAFAEGEDCSPVEEVVKNPRCIEIAQRFGKTPDEVSKDINRRYIESYRSL
jgi:hypothetical protein